MHDCICKDPLGVHVAFTSRASGSNVAYISEQNVSSKGRKVRHGTLREAIPFGKLVRIGGVLKAHPLVFVNFTGKFVNKYTTTQAIIREWKPCFHVPLHFAYRCCAWESSTHDPTILLRYDAPHRWYRNVIRSLFLKIIDCILYLKQWTSDPRTSSLRLQA